jgi:hypothetical protein
MESSFLLTLIIALMALALISGFVGSLSGLGGGMFIVPALVILAHVPMQVAVGASLMAVVATSAGASVAFVARWLDQPQGRHCAGMRHGDGCDSGRFPRRIGVNHSAGVVVRSGDAAVGVLFTPKTRFGTAHDK